MCYGGFVANCGRREMSSRKISLQSHLLHRKIFSPFNRVWKCLECSGKGNIFNWSKVCSVFKDTNRKKSHFLFHLIERHIRSVDKVAVFRSKQIDVYCTNILKSWRHRPKIERNSSFRGCWWVNNFFSLLTKCID